MKSINNDYKNVLKSDEQQYDAYIILDDNTKIDVDISGLKPIYNLGEKIVGNFTSKRVEFSLFNTSKYNITNKEFEVFIGLKVNNEFQYLSVGKYIADKPVLKDEATDENTIKAQDYSLKFKIKYEPILTFPCSVKKAISDICEYLNIDYIENNFINSDYVLQEFYIDEDATFFDVIKILVEAGFANAFITNTNALIVKSPSMTVDYELDLNELFELKKEDNKFGKLNSIVASRIVADDGSTTEDVYAKDESSITTNGLYEYKIIQNDAIDYDRQTAVNNILAGSLNFEYIPASLECVYNPALEIGDMIEVPDKKTDTSFLLFIKEISADLSTGLMTIESSEKTKTETDYAAATNKDKRRKTEIKVNKLEGEITQVVEKTEENTKQVTEIKTTTEGTTTKITDLEQELNSTTGELESISSSVNEISETVNGMEQTLSQQGGSNLLLNSSGLFENENWEGEAKAITNTDIQNNFIAKSCFLLQASENLINLNNQNFNYTASGVSVEKVTQDSVRFLCDSGTQAWTGVYSEKLNLENGVKYKLSCKISEDSDEIATNTNYNFGIANIRAKNKSTNIEDKVVQLNFNEKNVVKSGEFTTDTDTYDYYILFQPVVQTLSEGKHVEFSSVSLINVNNSISLKQSIQVTNGGYYVGFKYQKLIDLASCKIRINDEEIELTEMSLTEVDKIINVSNNSITIELISDTNDACLVGDLIVVQGTKQSWSSNMNEIYTSTVKIGIGLEIISNTMRTKLLANADGVRIVSTTNNDVVAEFTDKGMTTNELIAQSAQIAGCLIQKSGSQTWFSSLL